MNTNNESSRAQSDAEIAKRDAIIAMQAEALKGIIPAFKSLLDDIGGCDHSVGICCCDDYREIDNANSALSASAESVAVWEAKKRKNWIDEGVSHGADILLGKYPVDEVMSVSSFIAELRWALQAKPLSIDEKLLPLQRQVAMLTKAEWFADFFQRVCELSDRTSPDDEPDAIIANAKELKDCLLNTFESLDTQATAEAYDKEHAAKVLEESARRFDNLEKYQPELIGETYVVDELRKQASELRAKSAQKKE